MRKKNENLHLSIRLLEQSATEVSKKDKITFSKCKFIKLIKGMLFWHEYSGLSIVDIVCNEMDLNEFKDELLLLARSKDSFIRQEVAENVIPRYKNLQDLGEFKKLLSDRIQKVKHEAVFALWYYPYEEVYKYFLEGIIVYDKTHAAYCYEWFGENYREIDKQTIEKLLSNNKVKGLAEVGYSFFLSIHVHHTSTKNFKENKGFLNLINFLKYYDMFRQFPYIYLVNRSIVDLGKLRDLCIITHSELNEILLPVLQKTTNRVIISEIKRIQRKES